MTVKQAAMALDQYLYNWLGDKMGWTSINPNYFYVYARQDLGRAAVRLSPHFEGGFRQALEDAGDGHGRGRMSCWDW